MNLIAEHRLRNDPAEAKQIERWVHTFSEAARLSPAARNAFDLSLVEWITNIITYAYIDSGEHWITVRFFADSSHARAEIEDDGRPFNPLDLPPVDTSAPLEQRGIGGLGIHLIRTLMGSVDYRRADGRNRLTLTRARQ